VSAYCYLPPFSSAKPAPSIFSGIWPAEVQQATEQMRRESLIRLILKRALFERGISFNLDDSTEALAVLDELSLRLTRSQHANQPA